MAQISGAAEEKVFMIRQWFGLNENPDGDTKLKLGEASVIRNFRVTRDGNLQRRPGSALVKGLMQNYTLSVGDEAVVRVDEGYSSQLSMQPTASATSEGFVALSGDEVIVSHENAEAHTNWYWQYTAEITYQLVSCVVDDAARTFTWRMKRVRAVPATEGEPVAGLWTGNVKGKEYLVGACDGKLWKLHDGEDFCKVEIGSITTTSQVFMFGYSEKLYLMNGTEYKEWDGETLKDVEGYRPLVSVAVTPSSGGTTLEQINKLTGTRRCWISPDGMGTTYALPEKDLQSIDYVKTLATKEDYSTADYTYDLSKGTVTLNTPPPAGTNTIEIGWTVKKNFRADVAAMKYAESFNGATDNRVFLYGDGTNKAFYSGLDYDGNPRADYFPDLNVLDAGEANTPITAMIRHYSRLLVLKTDGAYTAQYGTKILADGITTAAFYSTPVNRTIGNVAPGQARLVLNSPRTLHGNDIFEWQNNASYMSVDERSAKRVSDRIMATLASFDLTKCFCWDDNEAQEYYICYQDRALVHNYAVDAWYSYDHFPVACMANFRGTLYFGTPDGRLASFLYGNRTDFGETIKSYWESGALDFDRDFMRKYSAMLWVGIKPESHGEVYVTVQTDRKSAYASKLVASSLASFHNANFRKWSFNTNRKPHMARLKIKAKKFVFYKLIFETESINSTVTVLSADLRVRYTGYAR